MLNNASGFSLQRIILVIVAGIGSSSVFADQYHFNSTLIGDRASGLGGAYVAVSDDPTGMFYNPAGLVYSSGNNLSASMNAFQYSKKIYRDVYGGGRDWQRTSSGLIPNFFGVTQKLGPGVFGFSYTVPDSAIENQDQTFTNVGKYQDLDFHVNFNNQDYTYNAGPSYAIAFGKSLSVGLTLYGYYKTQELILNQMIIHKTTDKAYEWSNGYYQYLFAGIKPIIGIMYSPIEKLSLGLTYSKTSVYYVDSIEQSSRTACLDDGGTSYVACTNAPSLTISKNFESGLKSKSGFPTSVDFGAAYFASHSLLVTASMKYNAPLVGSYSVINVAAGTEYFVMPTAALRFGFYTDFSATPPLVEGRIASYNEHIDLYGGSFSFTNFSRSSSLTLGLNVSAGKGQSQIFDDVTAPLQTLEMFNVSLFMSALYSY